MDISINYNRRDHQIRLLQKGIDLIEEHYGEFNYVKIGVDPSKKILVLNPLREKIEGSYRLSNRKSISSIELAKILKTLTEHDGLYRYPIQWHTELELAVVDLTKGQQQ